MCVLQNIPLNSLVRVGKDVVCTGGPQTYRLVAIQYNHTRRTDLLKLGVPLQIPHDTLAEYKIMCL